MSKRIVFFLSITLIMVLAYSYFCIPDKFEIEGGSCYQGITAMFIRFFLTICGVLNLLSITTINSKSKFKIAKVTSAISLMVWLAGFIIHSYNDFLVATKYFTPLLFLNFIIVVLVYGCNGKNKQSQND
ncbi:hypothetical protein IW15_06575 [Chryseobacterium soli]|uniref:Uncharacterized protein n=1 Tax=Chryseobacterium soli TaxID=445961 RepID=A0A086A9T8_9FLAO|nr:hypothetical protein [Chryseobacterium soli]KFF13452.1 hypothetical protein IW15_06575 [Chryseobacterium soli]